MLCCHVCPSASLAEAQALGFRPGTDRAAMAAKRTKVELEEALELAEAENRRLRDEKALQEAENRRLRTELQLVLIEELACKANLSKKTCHATGVMQFR